MPHEDQLPEPLPDLVQDLKNNTVVGVVGSGLSNAAGLPGWVELLRGVCDEAWATHITKRADIARAWELAQLQPLTAADLLKRVLGPVFCNVLGRNLQIRRGFEAVSAPSGVKPWRLRDGPSFVQLTPTASHRVLLRLGLRCLVTTNFDLLLETAQRDIADDQIYRPYSWSSSDVSNLLNQQRRLLLKLHGDVAHPGDIIAARTDYGGPYAEHPTHGALGALLRTTRPLWIGFGHDEPDLALLLDELLRKGVTGGYAIVPQLTPELELRLQAAHVAVIELVHHDHVPAFLRKLALAVGRPVAWTIVFAADADEPKRARRLGDLLESYGVSAHLWSAPASHTTWQLESAPADYRGLRDLLTRPDIGFLAKLAELGVRICDNVEVEVPRVRPADPRSASRIIVEATTSTAAPPSPRAPAALLYIPQGPPEGALADLFVHLFSQDELRVFLSSHFSDLLRDVNLYNAPRVVALDVADALGRRGLITHELLAKLRAQRPGRTPEIDALAAHLFRQDYGHRDSYQLFSVLLDREAAWQTLTRACERPEPVFFLLHGAPHQHLSDFMERVHRYLDDEDHDGVACVHQVCEVALQTGHARRSLQEEWEASFRRAMGFKNRGDFGRLLAGQLANNALMFLVRGQGSSPLSGLDAEERAGLKDFLGGHLPALLAENDPARRALRVLLGVTYMTTADPVLETLREALDAARRNGVTTHEFELHFPSLGDTLPSVERYLQRQLPSFQRLPPDLRGLLECVHREHERRATKNIRDLATDLFRVLHSHLPRP